MSRYYFHLTDGKQTLGDAEGLAAGRLMKDRNWSGWMIAIANAGQEVECVPIMPVNVE